MGSPSILPSAPPPLHWVKPPQQARSQKTLARMLDAAEELIAERGAAALTVSEVVRRAGSSVGAFYARFPDKDALLSVLHDRICGEAFATCELALDPSRWRGQKLEKAVFEVVRFTHALCRERRGLILAFIGIAAGDAAYAERRARLEAGFAELLHAFLVARTAEIAHPNLRLAATTSIRIILGTLEYAVLTHRGESAANPDDADAFAAELTRAVLRYLG